MQTSLNLQNNRISVTSSKKKWLYTKFLSILGTMKLIKSYTIGDIKKNPRSFKIGVFSIFIVVAFLTILQSVIVLTPVIFLQIAENQAGDADIIMTPTSAENDTRLNNSTGFGLGSLRFLNASQIENICSKTPTVFGCSSRWVLIGNATKANSNIKVKTFILVGDFQKERSIGLGRRLPLQPLQANEAYISRSTTASLGIPDIIDTTITLQMDIINAIISQNFLVISDSQINQKVSDEGYNATGMSQDEKYRIYIRSLLRENLSTQLNLFNVSSNQTLNTSTIKNFGNTVNDTLNSSIFNNDEIFNSTVNSIAQNLGLPSNFAGNNSFFTRQNANDFLNIISNLPDNQTFTYLDVQNTLLDVLMNSSNLLIDFKIKGNIKNPGGKWAQNLGNVLFLDSSWILKTLSDGFSQSIQRSYDNLNQTNYLGQFALRSLVEGNLTSVYTSFIQNINISEYAIMENAVVNDRIELYQNDDVFMPYFSRITDDFKKSFNGSQPFTSNIPLALTVQGLLILKDFLDNVIVAVIFILVLLSVLLIYSLMIFDVEDKTYEYGMTRALGFGKKSLILLLFTQGMTYALCGLTLGMLFAYICHAMIAFVIYDNALIASSFDLDWTSILLGMSIGILMPLISNIAPISKALSKALRDSLNLYSRTINEFQVRIQKLEKLGLSPGSFANAFMLIVVGLLTYYLAPAAFITQNIKMFLAILNIILLLMILGMSIFIHQIERYVTAGILWLNLFIMRRDQKLKHIIQKNMQAHESKNMKTSLIFSITIAFLIFSSTSFSLQEFFIVNLLRMTFGADIVVWAPPNYNKGLDEYNLRNFLHSFNSSNQNSLAGFSFVSNEIGAFSTSKVSFMPISNFPKRKCKIYGIEKNYLSSVYQSLYIPTDKDNSISYPQTYLGKTDLVSSLYTMDGIPRVLDVMDPFKVQENPENDSSNSSTFQPVIRTLIPEGLRKAMSLDPSTAAMFSFENGPAYLARIRGMAKKIPGFLFTSYQQAIFFMQLLVDLEDFGLMANIPNKPSNITTGDNFANLTYNIPKSRLLIMLNRVLTYDEMSVLQNGLRNFFTNDLTIMIDMVKTASDISDSFQLLQLLFIAVTIISIVISFFLILVSFISNIRNNSWEFGVLRAIGVNKYEITRIYLHEAVALMLSSSILGIIVGIIVAITVTLQLLLFLEINLVFTFPYAVFFLIFFMGIFTSLFGSYYAVRTIRDKSISDVTKGLI